MYCHDLAFTIAYFSRTVTDVLRSVSHEQKQTIQLDSINSKMLTRYINSGFGVINSCHQAYRIVHCEQIQPTNGIQGNIYFFRFNMHAIVDTHVPVISALRISPCSSPRVTSRPPNLASVYISLSPGKRFLVTGAGDTIFDM